MKRRVFSLTLIFLVIFQLFSPYVISLTEGKIEKKSLNAQVSTGSRGPTTACSIELVTEKQVFVTVGTAPGTKVSSINLGSNTTVSKINIGKDNTKQLFYAMRRSDQQTSGPYYLSTYVLDVSSDIRSSFASCTVTYTNGNTAYESGTFKVPGSINISRYEDIKYEYTDPNTNIKTTLDAKGIDPGKMNIDAIQFAPFAMNIIKSRENGQNTFQIAYLFISQKRAMADIDNIFINRELESTIKGGNGSSEIGSSEVSAGNVTYYSRYDSQIPGLTGYYEWLFVDKNKIIDKDNNLNYNITSSVSTSLSFAGSMGVSLGSSFGTLNPITSALIGLGTYFFSGKTTRTYDTIGFQYNGRDSGMHFSGIVRDVFAEVKDLQQLAGGGDEKFSFGIDKQKSAQGNNGIGMVIALEYGSNNYDEVIKPESYPKRTKPSAKEVTESQVFDSYYDIDLLDGDAGKNPVANGTINSEWEGFALVLTRNSKPNISTDSLPANSKVMNLNPYIIGDLSNESSFVVSNYNNEKNAEGKRVYPYYDQRKIYIVAEVNKNIFDDNNPLKPGETVYAYILSEQDSTNDDGVRIASDLIEFKITDQINQLDRTYGTVDDISQNEIDIDSIWLPTCDSSPSTWFTGCLVKAFYYIIYTPSAALLAVAGNIMDFVLAYSIEPDSYKAQYVVDGWRFVRDLCNLFFIFMLIYLAFKMVLGVGSGTKQLIVNTLIVATVINFSYPLTTVVIDVSNITARQLYYNAFSKAEDDGKPVSLSATAVQGYNPQKIILDGIRANSKTFSAAENPGSIFIILLMGVILNVLAMLMFLRIALQFVYRIIGLVLAIILSPLAVFSYSLSSSQKGMLKMVGFENWLQGLMKDAFKAPIFLFLTMILVLFVNNNPFQASFGQDVTGIEWWMSIIIPFALIFGFLKLIESATKSSTSAIAQMAGDGIVKAAAGVAGFGAAIATGGTAWAGRNLLGKKASRFMQSTAGEKLMTKAAEGNTWARLKVGALDMARKGSFDLRQNKAANAVSGFTGVNMQAGTNYIPFFGKQFQTATSAGGYMAQMQRKTARMKKFEESLGFDQEMYNKMEDVKEKAQRAANNQEDVINGLKERADSKFSEMRYHQQKAREHGAELTTTQKRVKEKDEEINNKQKEIDRETDATKKALLIAEKNLLEDNKNKLKKDESIHEENLKKSNEEASKAGKEEKDLREEIKIEKDKLDALKGDGYTYVDEKTKKAVHVLGVKGAEKAMEKVKTDRIDRYKQFQREKSGKIFKRKTGIDVYKEKIEKDLEEAETDEKIASRSDITEIMKDVETKARADKDWDDTNEEKKKELINKYKKDSEILKKHAKKRIYEAVYNSLDVDSMEGEAKEKALKDVEEAARDIEHLTYQLKSSPSGTRSKLGAVLNDSFLHTDVAKGSVLGTPFGWAALPASIATGLVRMAEYDRKFYENYGRSWQDKDTKVDTTDKYKPGK